MNIWLSTKYKLGALTICQNWPVGSDRQKEKKIVLLSTIPSKSLFFICQKKVIEKVWQNAAKFLYQVRHVVYISSYVYPVHV